MADVGEKFYAQFYVQVRKATSENYEKLRTAFRAETFSCSKTSEQFTSFQDCQTSMKDSELF
jgi:hypothetical protein